MNQNQKFPTPTVDGLIPESHLGDFMSIIMNAKKNKRLKSQLKIFRSLGYKLNSFKDCQLLLEKSKP